MILYTTKFSFESSNQPEYNIISENRNQKFPITGNTRNPKPELLIRVKAKHCNEYMYIGNIILFYNLKIAIKISRTYFFILA